jgi:hypothetical protein
MGKSLKIGDIIEYGEEYTVFSFVGEEEFCMKGKKRALLCNINDLVIREDGTKTVKKVIDAIQ